MTPVYFVIAVMILATFAVALFVLAPRMAEGHIMFEAKPDRPHPFGYRMAWLAIRTQETTRVLESLGLLRVQAANWSSGLGAVYDERLGESHIFVSPPIEGWTLVVGLSLPHPMGHRFADKSTPLLLELSRQFPDVQYFFSYPLIDYYAWARVVDAKIVRAFAIGDDGVICNKGRPTREERAMGLRLFELRGVRERCGDAGGAIILYPTERHLMELAARWSLDPTALDAAKLPMAVGYVGSAPPAWRAQYLPRTAQAA
jgi:hypothetical protein